MKRFYDLIAASSADTAAFIADYVSIDGTQIALQIDAMDSALLPFSREDYGVCIPPFRKCFIESAVQLPQGMVLRAIQMSFREREQDSAVFAAYRKGIEIPAATKWLAECWGWFFFPSLGVDIAMSEGVSILQYANDGTLLTDINRVPTATTRERLADLRLFPSTQTVEALPFVLMTLRAINRHAPIEYVKPNRAAVRRAIRKGDQPARPYYTVLIDPRKPRKVSEVGRPAKDPATRRTDGTVRGHVKFYADVDGHRLFGKHSGIYHIPERKGDAPARYTVRDDV